MKNSRRIYQKNKLLSKMPKKSPISNLKNYIEIRERERHLS